MKKECNHCGDTHEWPRRDQTTGRFESIGSDMGLCQNCEENEWRYYCDACKAHQVGDYNLCPHGFDSDVTEQWEGPGVTIPHGDDNYGRQCIHAFLAKFYPMAPALAADLTAGNEPDIAIWGDMFSTYGFTWYIGQSEWSHLVWPAIQEYRENSKAEPEPWFDGFQWFFALRKEHPEYIAEAAGFVAEWLSLIPQVKHQ